MGSFCEEEGMGAVFERELVGSLEDFAKFVGLVFFDGECI